MRLTAGVTMFAVVALAPAIAHAQGGPPLITDDPIRPDQAIGKSTLRRSSRRAGWSIDSKRLSWT